MMCRSGKNAINRWKNGRKMWAARSGSAVNLLAWRALNRENLTIKIP